MATQISNGSDTEESRREIIEEMVAERGPTWAEDYKPGSFGCHELLDRTSTVADMLERLVVAHPACALNPEWYALAERAASSLRDLYQRIGAEHLDAEGVPSEKL